MSGKRGMTEGEIELARSVYGDSIDYSEVEIHDHSYALTPGQVSAPNGDIYYPEGRYQDDFSEGGLGARKTFIHELGCY